MMPQWTLITPGAMGRPGDVYRLTYGASDNQTVRAWQASQIERELDKADAEFIVVRADYWQPQKLIFDIKIKANASGLSTIAKHADEISRVNPWGLWMAFEGAAKEVVADAASTTVDTTGKAVNYLADKVPDTIKIGTLAIVAGVLYLIFKHK